MSDIRYRAELARASGSIEKRFLSVREAMTVEQCAKKPGSVLSKIIKSAQIKAITMNDPASSDIYKQTCVSYDIYIASPKADVIRFF